MERPRNAPAGADNTGHVHLPVEGLPLAGSSPFTGDVIVAATRWGLDPALVLAVVETESRELADAVSPRGAVGLMQVLPGTALELGLPDTANPADPAVNLDAGCHYLATLLGSFGGDVELALAAYNAGPGAVRTWGTVPPYRETREFVARVGATYERLTGLNLRGATRFTAEPLALL
ncbi:MAG: lytic transglycosylase domain-containing protein [Thermoanaerobaculales bacterium]